LFHHFRIHHLHFAISDDCLIGRFVETRAFAKPGSLLLRCEREILAQGTESSKILARLGNLILEGFSQSASASRAFSTASASVSPALAQPGTSGKTADQRSVNLSFSTTTLNFIALL
jgi:hypothetical protein